MWFFQSPQIVYGEGSLSHLSQISGVRVLIVSDRTLERLGMVEKIRALLRENRFQVETFLDVESDPSVTTVENGAHKMREFEPDWIIALGGGSVMDATKAMWVLYERPDMDPVAINPIEPIFLRKKARMIAIPTTAGTGAEATWAIVLSEKESHRKLGLGNRECVPDLAILDPELTIGLPPRITADTGLDALTHAIEGYTSTWHNDFSDGLCLQAIRLIFNYLPRVYRDGNDREARERMQNAATIAGLGFGNAMAALAHGMGHALGARFNVPHGRAVALFLPYTIAYYVRGEAKTRYREIAQFLGENVQTENEAADWLIQKIRALESEVEQPLSIAQLGIDEKAFEEDLETLVAFALNDSQTLMGTRVPEVDELTRLFRVAYHGDDVTF
ncbi:iron-containing alcohol dehydrogenase [Anaerolinea thermophila]|uniref:NADPH-dependent butanol dehydrogenase n=1 Tax=Anaerolinea thermophila (strain DSM 14523 / JCM 11388 / NBRC 100420 / UNI-1) TaxID=926569 RepID=E8N4Y0_ANATU|nr:iron-containing alcohol dehydrogenase [Anaerolinea thermophila]BAJ63494.1 NADPH-dependent butanol dehydrogenase [Anaerolinea thermophila UNI-1]